MPETRRMRIAHVVSDIANEAAGPSYTVPALCDALAEQGADVALHVLRAGQTERCDAHYTLHAHAHGNRLRRIDASSALRRALRQSANDTDVFHSHGLWRMPGLYAAYSALRAHKPWLIAPRGMLEPAALQFSRTQKRLFWSAGQGHALFHASCLHATSEGELASIRKIGLRNPVALISNGIDLPEPSDLSPPAQERTLLYLGRLHPIKALDRLLDAWAQLEPRHPRWVLRLVGPEERGYLAILKAQCARLGLQRVSFDDAVFGERKRKEFAAAELYVLPSHSENFAMTVAEALAHGLPVVASRGAPWQGLEAHGCGRWIENTVFSLIATLDSLLRCAPQQLRAMGAQGRAWMRSDYSWETRARALLRVYGWLCGHDPSRPDCVETVNGSQTPRNWNLGAWWPMW